MGSFCVEDFHKAFNILNPNSSALKFQQHVLCKKPFKDLKWDIKYQVTTSNLIFCLPGLWKFRFFTQVFQYRANCPREILFCDKSVEQKEKMELLN